MQTCDRCGKEVEDLIAQPNGALLCLNCHRGLGPEFTDLEYNRLRMIYDKDANFKSLRHRFWALGIQRRYNVLRIMGYVKEGESLIEKIERFRLYKVKEAGLEGSLVGLIEAEEAQILAENEKSDYLAPKAEVKNDESVFGAHAGRVEMTRGPTNPDQNPNPWGDSQK